MYYATWNSDGKGMSKRQEKNLRNNEGWYLKMSKSHHYFVYRGKRMFFYGLTLDAAKAVASYYESKQETTTIR